MTALAIAILLVATNARAPEPDPLFQTPSACAVEPDVVFADAETLTAPAAPMATSEPRSLFLAAESRVRDEAPSKSLAIQVERLTAPSMSPHRLTSPGRAWPFALAATADAASPSRGTACGTQPPPPGRSIPLLSQAVTAPVSRSTTR